jgi:hypothetical protein
MNRFLRQLFPTWGDHLSSEQLADLFCGKLSLLEKFAVKRHLAACWQCRARRQDLEGWRADQMPEMYHTARTRIRGELHLPDAPRRAFLQQLGREFENTAPQTRWAFRLPKISLPKLPSMNPTLATCLILSLATAVSFFAWWQQRIPNISSNALLVRAERWDASSLSPAGGVVYQTVQITTPQQTMKRSIYRDVERKRQPNRVKLAITDEQLKNQLAGAGLDWNEPLSASSYQSWHDRQHVREDAIVRTGHHLLTLTTTVPEGSVSEQSLTVRETDFHPVERKIAFRDSGTIEIAELNYKILPWSSVDAGLFEPLASTATTEIAGPSRILAFPHVPERLTEGQLDETELSARLALNNLHADTGEQIEIVRTNQKVEVEGLVETNERKRELQTQLAVVPHLTVSIQSVADLKDHSGAGNNASGLATASMLNTQSPLETYLLAHGRSVQDIKLLEQRLFGEALAIGQESRAISDLQAHFASSHPTSVIASATLSELIYSHHERLQAALKQERALLGEIQIAHGSGNRTSALEVSPLLSAATRNLNLCKELTIPGSPDSRSVEKILSEISGSLDDLSTEVNEAYTKPQAEPTAGRTK